MVKLETEFTEEARKFSDREVFLWHGIPLAERRNSHAAQSCIQTRKTLLDSGYQDVNGRVLVLIQEKRSVIEKQQALLTTVGFSL